MARQDVANADDPTIAEDQGSSHPTGDEPDQSAWLKLALLSEGISVSESFIEWFRESRGFVRRRNFYNSPNWDGTKTAALPQEIQLTGTIPVVVAVNNYGSTRWQLIGGSAIDLQILDTRTGQRYAVHLVKDLDAIQSDPDLARLCNLYGGSALAFFSPRACYFFANGTECRFCSLAGTADEDSEYANRLTPSDIHRAVTQVLSGNRDVLSQVMIVGGNERNLDHGFRNQVALARAASAAIRDYGLTSDISVHLIVMPPRDHALIEDLGDLPNVHAGFNLEVWGHERFEEIAPGKARDYGQHNILTALERLRDAIGPYRAHSILIAGLEPPDSTLAGVRALAENGISAIVNSYHSDRHSALGLSIRPQYAQLAEVASGLQEVHDAFPVQPYWKGCGRNALDFEAAHGLFRGMPPDFS